jgi:hypothetical protein
MAASIPLEFSKNLITERRKPGYLFGNIVAAVGRYCPGTKQNLAVFGAPISAKMRAAQR